MIETEAVLEEEKVESKVDIMSLPTSELLGQLLEIVNKKSLTDQELDYKRMVVTELKLRKNNKIL